MSSSSAVISHYKRKMERHPTESDVLLHCLSKMDRVEVNIALLQETGIGRIVNSLKKSEKEEVAERARLLVSKWKDVVAKEDVEEGEEQTQQTQSQEEPSPQHSPIINDNRGEDEDSESDPPPPRSPSPPPRSSSSSHHKKHKKKKSSHRDSSHHQASSSSSSSGSKKTKKDSSIVASDSFGNALMGSPLAAAPSSTPGGSSSSSAPKKKKSSGDKQQRSAESSSSKRRSSSDSSSHHHKKSHSESSSSRKSHVVESTRQRNHVDEEEEPKKSSSSDPATPASIPSDLLPTISPHYKPLPPKREANNAPPKKFQDDDEALSSLISMSKSSKRTAVFSGVKKSGYFGPVPTLMEMCITVLQENVDDIYECGGLDFITLRPILERASPQTLAQIEEHNQYLMTETGDLWERVCKKNFPKEKRQEMESWREMFERCTVEREEKLNLLKVKVKDSYKKVESSYRQTKLAYVGTVAKPPRSVFRAQAKNGTAIPFGNAIKRSLTGGAGSSRSSSSSSSSFGSAPKKPKVAPLMSKTLKMARGIKGGFRR